MQLTAAQTFNRADLIWHDALVDVFGKAAGDARYTDAGKGDAGTALRAAYDNRTAARVEWEATRAAA